MWVLEVPDWLPTSLNQVVGRHWRRLHRAKQSAAAILGTYAVVCQVPKVGFPPAYRPKRRLWLHLMGWRGDPDNALKVFLDACVTARLLVDDGPAWLDLMQVEVHPGYSEDGSKPRPRTIIHLEDVTDADQPPEPQGPPGHHPRAAEEGSRAVPVPPAPLPDLRGGLRPGLPVDRRPAQEGAVPGPGDLEAPARKTRNADHPGHGGMI